MHSCGDSGWVAVWLQGTKTGWELSPRYVSDLPEHVSTRTRKMKTRLVIGSNGIRRIGRDGKSDGRPGGSAAAGEPIPVINRQDTT